MVSNGGLPQVLNKNTAAQNLSILFCVFIKELEQIVKNHTMTIISLRWPTKIYFCGGTCKSVQFFCLVKCLASANDGNFSGKHRSQRFEPHWYGEAFL